ncbi:MAG: PP2C family protein-serine/threonine phosphatase [Ruminiclostridium sp.]|nr:PP2C family protein-serine/threonine phosphatase [Ruminiclostridium sp.]
MKKRLTLTAKALLAMVALSVLMILFTCAGIAMRYYNETKAYYSRSAFAYTRTAAEFIDGDTIARYYETGEKDDYYYNVLNYLRAAQKESNLKYYYVFVPLEDEVVYIWDADNSGDACELGYHEQYMANGKENAAQSFRKDPIEEITINSDATYGYIASACSPVFDSAGEPVALVAVDMAMEGFIQALVSFMAAAAQTILVVIFVAILLLYYFMRRYMIKPIEILNSSAKKMVEHLEADEYTKIDIRTGDELQELAGSFNQMNGELRDYIRKLTVVTAEKERIGAELNVAAQIQADMLPSIFPPFPDRNEFDIYATMDPAKEVGGDFYDFFLIDDDHIALVMADVSGKGVPASLFMVIAKTLIKNHAQLGEYSPAKVLMQANEQLCEGNEAELFVTVWLAILEISTGKGRAANAGHEHPALRRRGGKYELIEYRHSPAVATMEGIRFREHDFELHPGDSVFVYTDGVPEATDAHNELYGTERMLEALNLDPEASPKNILENVKNSVDKFVGDAPQFDDLTMLGFTYFGAGGEN